MPQNSKAEHEALSFPPQVRQWLQQAMQNFWQFPEEPQDRQQKEEKANDDQSEDRQKKEVKVKEDKPEDEEGRDRERDAEPVRASSSVEYLRSMGEAVAAMLEPLSKLLFMESYQIHLMF